MAKAQGESLMHSAIIVVSIPPNQQRWNKFIPEIDRLQTAQPDPLSKQRGVEQLAENVWMVNFRDNPEPLARLISAAVQHRFRQRILQFDDAPQWLQVDSNLEPTGVPTGYSTDPPDDD
jgi:hypothetical protein